MKKVINLVSLMLYVSKKQTKDGKRKFTSYKTKMDLAVFDTDGNEQGVQTKYVNVKFPRELDVSALKRGILECKPEDISAPSIWKPQVNENGVIEYPVVWIRGFEKFTPKPKKHKFTFNIDDGDEEDEDEPESEIVEESETEETEIG